jgi:hypothetical protein
MIVASRLAEMGVIELQLRRLIRRMSLSLPGAMLIEVIKPRSWRPVGRHWAQAKRQPAGSVSKSSNILHVQVRRKDDQRW